MDKIDGIIYKKIDRISPSQFYSMKNCAYKSLLAEAFGKKPLLPVSSNAYFGTVLHKMLELIAKGKIIGEEGFNKSFDEQVQLQEDYLKKQGFDFFVPLQKNVKDFGMKKILLKKHLRSVSSNPQKVASTKYDSEKWLESKDKLIAGKVDLIIEEAEYTEIVDFKTGAITQDVLDEEGELFSEIKPEYKEQLKIYAYLYFETYGTYPTRLSLIDLAKLRFTIDFTKAECEALVDEAKSLLQKTNESIDINVFNANPSNTNCKYCLYRPACSFFRVYLQTDYSFNDIAGIIKKVITYQNGNISLFIENGGNKITVTGFPSEKYDALNEKLEKEVSVFNLRKEAMEFVYSVTKTTKIYEY